MKAREEDLALRAGELNAANEKLDCSNRELSEFAYLALHDLHEPLRMVDSYMSPIERGYDRSKYC